MNVNNVVRTITIKGVSDGVEKLTGDVNKLAAAQQNVAVVSETSAKRVLSLEDAWKKQSMKLDEAARSQANISRETKIADGALREGLINQQQHAERLDLIAKRYAVATVQAGSFSKQTGLGRYEMLNFSRQMQDVAVSLAGGQNPFVVLTQQGSQIADIFQASNVSVRGFFSGAIGWAGRFVASTAGVVTGVGAIAAGALYMAGSWSEAQREIDKSLIGIGRRSGVTAKDINEIARTSATATGLSVDEARGAALEFVKTGAIFRDNIKAAVAVTHDFAIVTGKNAKEAAQDLGAALASPLEGADALNTKIGFLDGRTREYIATLVSQNQKQEAQAVLLRNLAPAIADATNTLGPFEKAWNAVANAAVGAKNAIGSALTPNTNEQRRDALVGALNQRSTPLLEGTPVSTRDLDKSKVAAMRLEVEALNESLRETARGVALAFKGDAKISLDADNAVRELLPYIDQLKKVEELINKIKSAQASPGAQDRQGLGGNNQAALNAAEVLRMNISATADETARANTVALELAKTYNTTSIEVAKIRAALADQLVVASAVGGAARMAAQEQATYNDLIRQGKTEQDAAGVAADQRRVAQAQINTQAKEQLASMRDQQAVAGAVTGLQRIQAEEQATFNGLIRQGVGAGTAMSIAMQGTANAIAAANAGADRMLKTLQQEGELIRAGSVYEKERIEARQTYNNLIDKGVDAEKAAAVAGKQRRNAEERRERDEQKAADIAIRNIKTREDAWEAYAANVISWSVANDEAGKVTRRLAAAAEDASYWANQMASSMFNAGQAALIANAAFIPFATTWKGMSATSLGTGDSKFKSNQGGISQFNPAGYESNTSQGTAASFLATAAYGEGGFEKDASNPFSGLFAQFVPNAQGLETQVNKSLSGGPSSAINSLLSNLTSSNAGLVSSTAGLLSRLTGVLPEDQKAGAIQQQLDVLKSAPATLARSELVQQLNDQLKQLTQATQDNTSATSTMTDVLSPFYSSDPRRTHLGFRAFAEGGIAMNETFARIGEREPEVVAPLRELPRLLGVPTQAANNNQKPVTIVQNFHAPVTREMADMVKKTAFQGAQDARRALAG